MFKLIVRLIINAVALWVAVLVVSGVEFAEGTGVFQVLIIALVFGLVYGIYLAVRSKWRKKE